MLNDEKAPLILMTASVISAGVSVLLGVSAFKMVDTRRKTLLEAAQLSNKMSEVISAIRSQ